MASSISLQVPIKITKWKVKKGSRVSKGTILALYEVLNKEAQEEKPPVLKLKSAVTGTVASLTVDVGVDCPAGAELAKVQEQGAGCAHATVMKNMCADCGADLNKDLPSDVKPKEKMSASVAMVHNIPELIISEVSY